MSKACYIPGAMLDVLHVYRHDLDSRRRALMTEVILKVMQQALGLCPLLATPELHLQTVRRT